MSRLTDFLPAQWYGMKTVSVRIVSTSWREFALARRETTRTSSRSVMPRLGGELRVNLQRGSGYCCDERADATRLRAAEVLRDDAAGGEDDGYSASTTSPGSR